MQIYNYVQDSYISVFLYEMKAMNEITKQWIAQKVKELMHQKPLSQIRVMEICRAAGIGRATFYYHFRDKYDLVAWVFFHPAETKNIIDREAAAEGMRMLKKDLVFYRRAYEDTSQNALWNYATDYYTRAYTDLAEELAGPQKLTGQLRFSIRLYCYGAVAMAKEWILADDSMTAETLIDRMFHSMSAELRAVYFPDQTEQ